MKSIFGERLDEAAILPEYPRPQLRRDSYLNLNGAWEYAVTRSDTPPDRFDGVILVPFSPECELSGVRRGVTANDVLWYRRAFTLPAGFQRGRVLLHFGAVDQIARVFVNGTPVGGHAGGYTAFTCDITHALLEQNTLLVAVRDLTEQNGFGRGKQKTKRGGIWYTRQSGIWQTVWLESVPRAYIRALRLTPRFDEGELEITVLSDAALPCAATADGRAISFPANTPARLPMPGFIPWSPENPHLYPLTVSMGEDRVESYFGMRKFSVERDGQGVPRLFLNGAPYFHHGLLDQGYWPDGLYTAPSDEAMIFDIEAAKRMGFTVLRKHIKVEPMRWYYHCDRLGMLVWQDMVSGGGDYKLLTVSAPLVTGRHRRDGAYAAFARADEAGRAQYMRELTETVEQLYNVTSLCLWVPFNEGWGQFDARRAVERISALDGTRPIDHASGWHDQFIGNTQSLHVYFRPYRFRPDRLGRAVMLTEFGGYGLRVPGRCFGEREFGYKRCKTPEALAADFRKLYEEQIIPAARRGLCAAIYTQLTDVEDETNGLLTYDRAVQKLPDALARDIAGRLRDAGKGA